jgi:hypothetical protein
LTTEEGTDLLLFETKRWPEALGSASLSDTAKNFHGFLDVHDGVVPSRSDTSIAHQPSRG